MTKKIKIGIDIRDLRIAKTGARTYLEELCREFSKPDPFFDFVFLDTFIPVYTGKNKLLKLVEQARFFGWKQITLPLIAWLKGCDILFCTDYFVPLWKPGLQTIPVFHDAFLWEYPSHYNKYWLELFYSIGIRAAKTSPFIVTSSAYARDQIALHSSIPAEKIIPVHEAPKTLLTNAAANEDTVPAAIKELLSSNYILHVGTFEKRKNLPILIQVFERLLKEGHPELKLVLLGQGSPKKDMDDSDMIRDLIQAKNLNDRVFMPGYVSDAVLSLFYRKARLYVFPSRNEGFGIPVLEAFSYGLPVIIANNSCLPEIAGNAAISFDPDDETELFHQTKLLLENEAVRDDLVEKMKIRLTHFSWAKTASELKALFKRAASG